MSVFFATDPMTCRCLFILKGWFLEAPIQKLPEDTFTTVQGVLGRESGWGVVSETPEPKSLCAHIGLQGVPVTHNESFPDSLSSS